MLSEERIRQEIAKLTDKNMDILDCGLATIDINAPRALRQINATTALDVFYFVIGEKRPKFKCDNPKYKNT